MRSSEFVDQAAESLMEINFELNARCLQIGLSIKIVTLIPSLPWQGFQTWLIHWQVFRLHAVFLRDFDQLENLRTYAWCSDSSNWLALRMATESSLSNWLVLASFNAGNKSSGWSRWPAQLASNHSNTLPLNSVLMDTSPSSLNRHSVRSKVTIRILSWPLSLQLVLIVKCSATWETEVDGFCLTIGDSGFM